MKLMMTLGVILLVLMALVGGNRGIQSFLALIGNLFLFFLYLFLVRKGVNPVLASVVAAGAFIGMTLFYQNGNNEKTMVSAISVVITELCVGIVAAVAVHFCSIAGLNELDLFEDESMAISQNLGIPLNQVMLGVILIGLLGAIMDTSMSIASGMFEIKNHQPQMPQEQFHKAGMQIGRDILGTTLNTLFFVALGEMMMLVLLIQQGGYTLTWILNAKVIMQEILPILISCLGCLMIIPTTVKTGEIFFFTFEKK